LSDATLILLACIVFFALLALLAFVRILLRRNPPSWRRIAVGVFVERRPDPRQPERPGVPPTRKGDDDEPPHR